MDVCHCEQVQVQPVLAPVPRMSHMLKAVPDNLGLAVLVPFERPKRVALQAMTCFRISAQEVAS
jgi:hypothetical protein